MLTIENSSQEQTQLNRQGQKKIRYEYKIQNQQKIQHKSTKTQTHLFSTVGVAGLVLCFLIMIILLVIISNLENQQVLMLDRLNELQGSYQHATNNIQQQSKQDPKLKQLSSSHLASLYTNIRDLQKFKQRTQKENQDIRQNIRHLLQSQQKTKNQLDLKQSIDLLFRKLSAIQNPGSNMSSELSSKELVSYAGNANIEKQLQKIGVIVDFLYQNDKQQFFEKKMKYFQTSFKSDLLKQPKVKQAFALLRLNYKPKHANSYRDGKLRDLLNQQRIRLNNTYPFQQNKLQFCLVVKTFNNADNYRYQYNLQSIYNLDYDPSKITVIITDDSSTDLTPDLIQKYLDQHPTQMNITLIRNSVRATALPNHHRAIHNYCPTQSIVVIVDGDDELTNPYSLQVFNSVYQSTKAHIVYSNHMFMNHQKKHVNDGWSRRYPEDVKRQRRYRTYGQRINHLRSFKSSLFRHIKITDMKDPRDNQWYPMNIDAIYLNPMLQMSCGKIQYIEQYFYLYNFGTGMNVMQTNRTKMDQIGQFFKHHQKYNCLPQYQ